MTSTSVLRILLVVSRVLFIAVATLFFLAFALTFFGGAQRVDVISGFTSFCASLVPWFLKELPLPVTPYNGYCHLDYGICFIVCGLCDFACAKFFARLPSQTV